MTHWRRGLFIGMAFIGMVISPASFRVHATSIALPSERLFFPEAMKAPAMFRGRVVALQPVGAGYRIDVETLERYRGAIADRITVSVPRAGQYSRVVTHHLAVGAMAVFVARQEGLVWISEDQVYRNVEWSGEVARFTALLMDQTSAEARPALLCPWLAEARASPAFEVATGFLLFSPAAQALAGFQQCLPSSDPSVVDAALWALAGNPGRGWTSRAYREQPVQEARSLIETLTPLLLGLIRNDGVLKPSSRSYLAEVFTEHQVPEGASWAKQVYLATIQTNPPPHTQASIDFGLGIFQLGRLRAVEAVPRLREILLNEVDNGQAAVDAAKALVSIQGREALPTIREAYQLHPQRGGVVFSSFIDPLLEADKWRR